MDFILGAKRTDKMGSVYSGRTYRAKKANPYTILIIDILRLGAVRATIRLLILALFLLSLLSLISIMRSAAAPGGAPDSDSVIRNYFKILPILCHDLIDEGLIKKGHRGLIVGASFTDIDDDYVFLKDTGVNLTTEAGLEEKRVVEDHVFDFVFTPYISGIKLIDRVVKNGGMAISPLRDNLMLEIHELNNYRIVYLRIFKNTVVAMRKENQPKPKKSALLGLRMWG